MESKKLLSIILLSYYSGSRIINCYKNISEILNKEEIPFEFIVVDDGSKDNSYDVALQLQKSEKNVFAYQLSRNYTSHYSIFAGLSICNGSCAMPMVDDEQQPYQTIVDMYRLWEKGENIIIPVRNKRDDSFLTSLFANTFHKIMHRIADVEYPKQGADLFFIDREIIDILNNKIHPINTSSLVEILRLGFDPYYLPYDRPLGLNKNKSRWSFKKKIKLAKDMIFSTSSAPIKIITISGFLFSVVSIIVIIFYIFLYLFGSSNFGGIYRVPGWTSIILFISFFSGLILLSLGVIAEYIWRIYEEVKARPGFIIKKKEK